MAETVSDVWLINWLLICEFICFFCHFKMASLDPFWVDSWTLGINISLPDSLTSQNSKDILGFDFYV